MIKGGYRYPWPMAEALACVNHPNTETRVRCSSCGNPICVRCMRQSAVGMKCPRCAQMPKSALRMGKPRHYVLAAAVGLGVAAVFGVAASFFSYFGFGLLLGIVIGFVNGAAISRAASGLSHTPIRVIAFVTTAVGLMAGPLLVGFGIGFVTLPRWLLGVFIASAIAAYRVAR
jgi:hypothetical protein